MSRRRLKQLFLLTKVLAGSLQRVIDEASACLTVSTRMMADDQGASSPTIAPFSASLVSG